ncbi:MAG: peptide chain release factor N(5)-glutamine methyltransferase [Christensenellales bacterium]|jgi:release factor glutamine methyltransferase
MKISWARRRAEEILRAAGVPDPGADGDWLICHVIGCERGELLLLSMKGREISSAEEERLFVLLKKRGERVPLQRLTGRAYFMGMELIVFDDVLIPRQDTEILCEAAVGAINEAGYKTALDLCCGSGAVALGMAKLTRANVTASDISDACIAATKANAAKNGASLEVIKSDLFSGFEGRTFDIITCNPPYVPEGDRAGIQPEVRHDPALALYSGGDGLDFIRRLAASVEGFLNPAGRLLLEFADGQAEAVKALFRGERGHNVILHRDMQGLHRVAEIFSTASFKRKQ